MKDHDLLIERLSQSARPVKRPLPPGWRVLVWASLALPCGAVAGLLARRALTDWSQSGALWAGIQLTLSLLMSVLAMRSAFTMSIAGRRGTGWKAFLPLTAIWLAVSLVNMPTDKLSTSIAEGSGCYLFLVMVSAPMAAIMIAIMRRTLSLYPVRSLAMAGFGVSWMAMSLLAFCHPVHFHLHDLAMHLAASMTTVALTVVAGRRWVAIRPFP